MSDSPHPGCLDPILSFALVVLALVTAVLVGLGWGGMFG